jgi:glycosyltransferase involved in cell wall biosynthesis
MNIIMIANSFDSLGGGAQSRISIANALCKQNCKVKLVATSRGTILHFDEQLFKLIAVKPNRLNYLLNGIGIRKKVKQILRSEKIDLIFGNESECAFLPGLLKSKNIVFAMMLQRPSYQFLYGKKEATSIFKRIINLFFRLRLFKFADLIFASSNYTRRELVSKLGLDPKKIMVQPMGVDNIFKKIKKQPMSNVSKFIFFGTFEPNKGVFDAVDALSIVVSKGYRNCKLKIIGWGDKDLLIKYIKNKRMTKYIQIIDKLPPGELIKHIKVAHLAILPSREESFGRSIAESQASGLPVVSYDIDSVPEIVINGKTGILVKALRTDLLADAVIKLINNPKLAFKMGMEGKKRSVKFTWEKKAESIISSTEKFKK